VSAALVAPRPIAEDRSDALEQIAAGLEGMARGIRLYGEILGRQPVPRGPELLTIEDAARILHCSGEHVRARMRDGQLKGFRDGRIWRVAQGDLDAYMRRRTR
jgi:excisionase family DNA binding protein